jgi:hypothetical protein
LSEVASFTDAKPAAAGLMRAIPARRSIARNLYRIAAKITEKWSRGMIWTLLPQTAGLRCGLRSRTVPKEATMNPRGAVFQPEVIELMKAVLDDAAAMLPEAKRTSAIKAEIASHILASAAKGERDPMALKLAALSAVIDCTHYSHDISPERRVV